MRPYRFLAGRFLAGAIAGVFPALIAPAAAGPWAEMGNAQLRSDIELLAANGAIDNVTTQWPIPWGGVLYRLEQPQSLLNMPPDVLQAAARVERIGQADTRPGSLHYSLGVDLTNAPDVVRGFDAMGRGTSQGQATVSWNGTDTAINLSVGAQQGNRGDKQSLLLDNSYIAQRVGNAAVYAGYLTHWWGPGWTSALSLSNNARPFPQIGITRIDTTGFSAPAFSWIGPWQAEFFVGVLDGPRVARNTLVDGLRFSFNPIHGLEIGIARLDELCGTGHPCKPFATYVDLRNDPAHPSRTNDEANIDIKYSDTAGGIAYSVYMQLMNEDTSPIVHSGTSHLFGLTTWLPVASTPVRLTAEYTDSIATKNIFSFGENLFGFSYNDYKYTDGMRYRDRTLGFSLDNDSRLASIQASWLGLHNISYTVDYNWAYIGHSPGANIVATAPTTINIGEAKVTIPFKKLRLSIALRAQDDQPRPKKGALFGAELALNYAIE